MKSKKIYFFINFYASLFYLKKMKNPLYYILIKIEISAELISSVFYHYCINNPKSEQLNIEQPFKVGLGWKLLLAGYRISGSFLMQDIRYLAGYLANAGY